jgi:hypothetical protein
LQVELYQQCLHSAIGRKPLLLVRVVDAELADGVLRLADERSRVSCARWPKIEEETSENVDTWEPPEGTRRLAVPT